MRRINQQEEAYVSPPYDLDFLRNGIQDKTMREKDGERMVQLTFLSSAFFDPGHPSK